MTERKKPYSSCIKYKEKGNRTHHHRKMPIYKGGQNRGKKKNRNIKQ